MTTKNGADSPPEKGALQKVEVLTGEHGLELRSLDEMYKFCKLVAASDLAPKGMRRPEQIAIAIQAGAELGLKPMQALSAISVVNGRATVMGDVGKAIVRASGVLEDGTDIRTGVTGEGDDMVGYAEATRRGKQPVRSEFSVEDAKRAGLWKREGPWRTYPKRMLAYRAWGFMARDHFADVLLGMYTTEEARDAPVAHATVESVSTPPPEKDPLMDEE